MILDLKRRIEILEQSLHQCQENDNELISHFPTHSIVETKRKKVIYIKDMKQTTQTIYFYHIFENPPEISFRSDALKESLYLKITLQKEFVKIEHTNFLPISGILIVEGI